MSHLNHLTLCFVYCYNFLRCLSESKESAKQMMRHRDVIIFLLRIKIETVKIIDLECHTP